MTQIKPGHDSGWNISKVLFAPMRMVQKRMKERKEDSLAAAVAKRAVERALNPRFAKRPFLQNRELSEIVLPDYTYQPERVKEAVFSEKADREMVAEQKRRVSFQQEQLDLQVKAHRGQVDGERAEHELHLEARKSAFIWSLFFRGTKREVREEWLSHEQDLMEESKSVAKIIEDFEWRSEEYEVRKREKGLSRREKEELSFFKKEINRLRRSHLAKAERQKNTLEAIQIRLNKVSEKLQKENLTTGELFAAFQSESSRSMNERFMEARDHEELRAVSKTERKAYLDFEQLHKKGLKRISRLVASEIKKEVKLRIDAAKGVQKESFKVQIQLRREFDLFSAMQDAEKKFSSIAKKGLKNNSEALIKQTVVVKKARGALEQFYQNYSEQLRREVEFQKESEREEALLVEDLKKKRDILKKANFQKIVSILSSYSDEEQKESELYDPALDFRRAEAREKFMRANKRWKQTPFLLNEKREPLELHLESIYSA